MHGNMAELSLSVDDSLTPGVVVETFWRGGCYWTFPSVALSWCRTSNNPAGEYTDGLRLAASINEGIIEKDTTLLYESQATTLKADFFREFNPYTIHASDLNQVYTGSSYCPSVEAPAGATVSYSGSKCGPYSIVPPVFTDVVTTQVWYRIEKDGYKPYYGSVLVNIKPVDCMYYIQSARQRYPWNGLVDIKGGIRIFNNDEECNLTNNIYLVAQDANTGEIFDLNSYEVNFTYDYGISGLIVNILWDANLDLPENFSSQNLLLSIEAKNENVKIKGSRLENVSVNLSSGVRIKKPFETIHYDSESIDKCF